MECVTLEDIHLATRRRNVCPTAIGRIPLSFFRRGMRLAPKKKGLTDCGTSPRSTKLAKLVSDRSNTRPPSSADALVESRRCCGRIPSGPPADPRGNDLMEERISSSNISENAVRNCQVLVEMEERRNLGEDVIDCCAAQQ